MAELTRSALPLASTTLTSHPLTLVSAVAPAVAAWLFGSFTVMDTSPSTLGPLFPPHAASVRAGAAAARSSGRYIEMRLIACGEPPQLIVECM